MALAAFTGLAGAAGAVFLVNSTADAVDASPGDGACSTAAGACTLRAAVMEANALPGADTIRLPGGTYALAIASQGSDSAASGDLDITESVAIVGAGAGSSVVDAGNPPSGSSAVRRGLDRLFEVGAAGGTVTLSDLTLSDGYASEYGGAILNSSTATVVVANSILRGNTAGKQGGAIDNHLGGRVEVRNSTLLENYAVEGGSALNNNRDGVLEVVNSTVRANSALAVGLDPNLSGGAAIANNAELDAVGTISVIDSQILENRSGGGRGGAGISNDGTGWIVVERTTFSKNVADGNGGGLYSGPGQVTVRSSTFSDNAAKGGAGIASTGNLTVLDSLFAKNTARDWGGGILNINAGAVTIRSTTFTENSALAGGGFANEGSGLVSVESSTFTKNRALEGALSDGGEGAGMHSSSAGEVLISGGRFSENVAHDGGGLSNQGGGRVVITGTLFSANVAEQRGGGILIEGGDVRMVGIDVVGNLSKSAAEGGGGISYAGDKSAAVGESAAIEGSRIRDNKAAGPGGGIDSRGDGPLAIVTTSVTGNTATIGGGLHHVGDATLLVSRSTISANVATNGGGVFTDGDGEATLENSTISANRAADFGGGVLVSSRLTVRHSSVVNNLAASGGGINNGGGNLIGDGLVFLASSIVANNPAGGNCAGAISSRGGNVENTNTCQLRQLTDHPGTDPLLGTLQDNGGPTLTHALLGNSPAQDAAVCTDVDPCAELDQRGIERPLFAGFDAGAFESELAPSGGGTQVCAGRTERPVPADYDSWISQSSSGGNFGTDAILKVSGSARALVHFGLPPIPPGCKLVDASLRLHASSATTGRTLEALRVAAPWTERGVTWSNQPATAGAASVAPSGLGLVEWDVLAQTLDMYASGAHGFLVRDAASGGGDQSFHSREKLTNAPELVLVFDDPDAPPPAGECATVPQLLNADRDSWLSQGSPSNNFGGDSTLKVRSQSGSNTRALVRFPLPPLPPGCTSVSSAVLRVHVTSAKEGRTLHALRAAGGWTESGVTWNNQPSSAGPAAAVAARLGVVEWDVTEQVLGMYLFENNGFVIRDAVENGGGDEQSLNSREKVSGVPELVFVFDDSTPETTIVSGPEPLLASGDATFTFSSDRADATFQCSLDGAAFAPCPTQHSFSGVDEGEHVLQVRATRPVRAIDPTPAVWTWTVDTTPPRTSIESGPSDPTGTTSASLSFFADEAATFECALDGATFADCASPQAYAGLAEGSHAVDVRATDAAGNVEPVPARYSWAIDVTPPRTTIDAAPSNPSNQPAVAFTFSADERATFECSADGGEFAACDSPAGYTGLTDGTHTFRVRATDAAANVEPEAVGYTWTIDTVVPNVTIDAAPEELTSSETATLTFSADESEVSFACSLDGELPETCASPAQYADLGEGGHTFRVQASDAAGNTGVAASYSWTIDATPPRTTIDSGPPSPTNSTVARFIFSADEDATFECALDGTGFGACTSPLEHVGLSEGSHVLRVRATDGAGNVELEAAVYGWAVDLTSPESTIDSGPPDPTNSTSASFAFSSNEDGATFECSLDGAEFAVCASPAEYAALGEGSHTFRVRATDAAGNADPSVASHEWSLDTTPPHTTIDSGPASPTNSTTAGFGLSTSEAATLECSLDGADFAECNSRVEYTELSAGSHTLRVQATDAAGNIEATPAEYVWAVDTTPPQTTIDSGPPDPTSRTDASFGFSAGEAATFECSLNGGSFATCTSPSVYTSLAEGEHTFLVQAMDAAGNLESAPATHSWTVDVTPPETGIDAGPSNPTNSTSARFTFSADEAATFECSIDDSAFAACGSPTSYIGLRDGTHTIRIRATDVAGNVQSAAASYTWAVDTTPPGTTIESGPATLTSSTSARFSFSSSEGATFACALDGAPFAACTSPHEYTGLAEGGHSMRVQATDAAGNTDTAGASYSWSVDTTPPDTAIESGPPDPTTSTTASFEFSSSETGSSFACSLDGAPFDVCISPRDYDGLVEGSHTFRVRATDAAGNVEPVPAEYAWTISVPRPPTDETPPETTIESGPASPTNSTSAGFSFSSSESGSTFECSLDGGTFVSCTSPLSYTGLTAGDHTFRVRATDDAGNVDATPAGHTWTVDTTAPQSTITAAPASPTSSTSASFSFASTETGSTFECSLDNSAFTACTSPRAYSGLSDGAHAFAVRASDGAGNVDGTPAAHTWTIDTTAPQTTITAAPADPTNAATASFTFSASEPGSSFECSLDSSAFAACTSPRAYTALTGGSHTFRVRATDSVGNVDPTPASHGWTVDTTAPQTTISSGPASPTNATSTSFSFTSSEAASTFECSLDGAAFAACVSPRAHSGLAAGSHTFQVRAIDAAGNLDASPATLTWTIDTTAPQTTISAAPPNPTTSSSASFSFGSSETGSTFECSLDAAAFAGCTSPRAYAGLAAGSHTFRVRAIDAAGNVDATPATHTWTVEAVSGCGSPVTVAASADAWIEQNSASNNKGSDSILKLKAQGATDNFRALVRFALPTNVPAGCTIQSATLRLYAPSATSGRTIQALALAGSWAENSVTWNNQPGVTGAAATTASGTGWREWNVTALVQAMYGGSANNGFLIRDALEGGSGAEQQFNSREKGENAPQLVITFGSSN